MDDQQADAESGDVEVPVIPEEPATVAEPAAEPEENAADTSKQKISQAKWQKMVESSKTGKQLLEKVAEVLGVEAAELPEATDLMSKLESEVKTLKELSARKDWEADHPEVRKDKYREEWSDILRKKGHLVQSGDLSYDELFSLIRKDTTVTPREFTEQQRGEGSVLPASKAPITSGMDSEVEALLRKALPNVPMEKFQ